MSATDNPRSDTMLSLFPTFVVESFYPGFAELKAALVERVYAIRDADELGRERCQAQYHSGYTSYFSLRELHREPVFTSLGSFLGETALKYARFQKWDLANYELRITTMWVNINPTGSFHPDHNHPYSHISGVFYVSCSRECGDLALRDPRPGRAMVPPPTAAVGVENALVWRLKPEEGKAVMFPSWLVHGVQQNAAEMDRLSISYNFDLRPTAR